MQRLLNKSLYNAFNSGEGSICSSKSCHLKKSNIFIVKILFLFFNITDKWEQSVLIVDEANDISYCVGNKGKNHAARFRSPNGLVIIPALSVGRKAFLFFCFLCTRKTFFYASKSCFYKDSFFCICSLKTNPVFLQSKPFFI